MDVGKVRSRGLDSSGSEIDRVEYATAAERLEKPRRPRAVSERHTRVEAAVNAGTVADDVKIRCRRTVSGNEPLTRRLHVEWIVRSVCDKLHRWRRLAAIKGISKLPADRTQTQRVEEQIGVAPD
jgi:hypothetical protein